MPAVAIVPVVVAAASIAVEGVTVFTAIAALGAALSVVGSITHDQTLGMVGSIVGAVGAVGGLASAAGLIDVGAEAGVGTAGDIAAQGGTDAGTWAGSVPVTDTTPDIVNSISGAVTNPAATALPTAATDVAPPAATLDAGTPLPGSQPLQAPSESLMATMPKDTGTAAATTGVQTPTTAPPAATDTSVLNPSQANPATTGLNAQIPGYTPGAPGSYSYPSVPTGVEDTGSIWSKLGNMATSPTFAAGLIQAGGAFLGGATSSLTPAQVAALQAQAQLNQAQSNLAGTQQQLLQNQLANLGQPMPTANPGTPGPGPTSLNPPSRTTPPGLMNLTPGSNPNQTVTGRVSV